MKSPGKKNSINRNRGIVLLINQKDYECRRSIELLRAVTIVCGYDARL